MMNISKILRILSPSLALIGFVLLNGHFAQSHGQQGDPFQKPGWAKSKTSGSSAPNPGSGQRSASKPVKAGPPPVIPVAAPEINQRINYYKQMRLQAAENGMPLPKVTSVLTLEEMAITGIFRTPRGYAAMVEAKPIKLSYTIYPGEKFFDAQLVAVEENRLVFRKVTKMSNGKLVASVENKALRQYTDQEQIRGTAPIEGTDKPVEAAGNTAAPLPPVQTESKPSSGAATAAPTAVVSPLEEINRQPQENPKDAKSTKNAKKPVKVAKNKK